MKSVQVAFLISKVLTVQENNQRKTIEDLNFTFSMIKNDLRYLFIYLYVIKKTNDATFDNY